MNLKEFTENVDNMAQKMNQDQLQLLIHSISRKVPEENREEFLEFLSDIHRDTNIKNDECKLKIDAPNLDIDEIKREKKRLEKLLCEIKDEKIVIQASGYEDYSQGYGYNGWNWEYEDTEEVRGIYEDTYHLIVRCVNERLYGEAVELFDLISNSEVIVENDYDNLYMGIEELQDEEIICVNLENLALNVLYAAYQDAVLEERAQKLYAYFSIPFFKNISLERMLSIGKEELKNLSQFWEAWISLMIEMCGDTEQRLLEEAVIYHHGEEKMLSIACLACENHPSLYIKVLQRLEHQNDNIKLLETGKEALEKINKKFVIRSEIALKTAEAAINLGNEAEAKIYWVEALRSNTTPVNFLRLMVSSKEQDNCLATMREIISDTRYCDLHKVKIATELTPNYDTVMNQNILRFLDGDFEFVMKQCSKVEEPLGWSLTFMNCGIALFLLLLLEDNELQQGCEKMAEIVRDYMEFNAKTYFKGTNQAQEYRDKQISSSDECKIFWKCFVLWKSEFSVTSNQVKQYLTYLENTIDKRITAIVSGQFRAHYSNVAILAAALGEVKESRGEMYAKDAIFQKYRAAFPRHSSFQATLRECGMKCK